MGVDIPLSAISFFSRRRPRPLQALSTYHTVMFNCTAVVNRAPLHASSTLPASLLPIPTPIKGFRQQHCTWCRHEKRHKQCRRSVDEIECLKISSSSSSSSCKNASTPSPFTACTHFPNHTRTTRRSSYWPPCKHHSRTPPHPTTVSRASSRCCSFNPCPHPHTNRNPNPNPNCNYIRG